MDDGTTELPQERSVKASQQFEDLELIYRSQAGDTEAYRPELSVTDRSVLLRSISGYANCQKTPEPYERHVLEMVRTNRHLRPLRR